MKNPPLNFIKGVKEAMVKFIWKGKTRLNNYDTLIQNKNVGGIGLPDLASHLKSQRIMWVKRLITNDEKSWINIASYYFGQNFPHVSQN